MYTPALDWLDVTGKALSGATINPKFVLLSETPDMWSAPTRFKIWRAVNPISHGLAVRLGRAHAEEGPWRSVLDPGPGLSAVPTGAGEYRSTEWAASVVGRSNQTTYRFGCDNGHESPKLIVSAVQMSLVTRALRLFGRAHDPADLASAELEAGVGTVEIICKAVTDPSVKVEIIWPWTDGDVRLRDMIREEVFWPEEAHDHSSLDALLDELLPASVPQDWQVAIEESEFRLDEGDERELSVAIDAPGPGRAVFAVAVRDVERPERYVVGDIIDYNVTEETESLATTQSA
jgi:hypothetical protein